MLDTNRDTDADRVEIVDTDDEQKDEKDSKKGGRGCGCWIALILILLAGGGASAFVGATTLFRTEKPLPFEREGADLLKRLVMIPGEFADMRIPEKSSITAETGKKLFMEGDYVGREAFSCATCHGPSGRGDSRLGAAMYPPANDLTAQGTQSKSDGQLFWLIAHGLNLTGMPAWGQAYNGPYTDDEIWSLVSYVREIGRERQGQR